MNWTIQYHLVPDGVTTIVRLTIESDFTVNTATAAAEAEDGLVKVMARLTGLDESAVRAELNKQLWIGDGWRPNEPE